MKAGEGLETQYQAEAAEMSDDRVQEMLQLAERLRASQGGELDEAALQAVAEATNAPLEYVRLAMRMEERRRTGRSASSIRDALMEIDPTTRRLVTSSLFGALWALTFILAQVNGEAGREFFYTLGLLILGGGIWNLSQARDVKTSTMAGALIGGSFFLSQSLFAYALNLERPMEAALMVPFVIGGALLGFGVHTLMKKYRKQLGMVDPAMERQVLLRQLVDLQEKLRTGEQSLTILSVDIVGSTRMKAEADPLSVEFTFNEYHQYVDSIARRHGGRTHSTAGDGVTLAFESPHAAFLAAKNLQSGLIELNTFRNKIGQPIQLRIGIHSGTVVAPNASDIRSVNFAQVIDLAAHLQKACPIGAVAISDYAAQYLPGGASTVGTETIQAMDVRAYVWKPRTSLALPVLPTPTVPSITE